MSLYHQVKAPDGGGIIQFSLDFSKSYSVAEIIEMGVEEFKKTDKLKRLENAHIELGFFKNKAIIPKFTLRAGDECGLWEYLRDQRISFSRLHLYMYSTELKHNNIDSEDDSSSDDKENLKFNECKHLKHNTQSTLT